MPAKNIGAAGSRRFHNGGTLVISDGVDDFTILKIESGTLRLAEGSRQIAYSADQGEQLQPTLGDKQYTSIELDVKFTDEHGTDSLEALMAHTGVTDGLAPEYTVTITFFDDDGQTTGISVTYALTHFAQGFELNASASGEQADRVPIRLMSRTMEGTWADVS